MKRFPITKSRGSRAGFSLIEVTIALGITAIALVSLMGMLPKGMETLRAAADKAIEGRIHQQILGELQLTPWEAPGAQPGEGGGGGGEMNSPIDAFHKQVRFYDDQGIEIPASDKGEVNHVYTARINLPQVGESTPLSVGGASHPGVMEPLTGTSTGESTYLRLVIVEVTSMVDPRFLLNPVNGFDSSDFQKHIRTFQTVITKMGQEFDPSEPPEAG